MLSELEPELLLISAPDPDPYFFIIGAGTGARASGAVPVPVPGKKVPKIKYAPHLLSYYKTERQRSSGVIDMIKKNIVGMSAYKPPLEGRSANDYLLFDFNERTIPVSSRVKQALLDSIHSDCLQQYPAYGNFLDKLAHYTGVHSSELLITNGSDQGIELVYRLVADSGDEAIVPVPTFPMHTHSGEVIGVKLLKPTYTDDYQYPLEEVLSLVSAKTKVIVVSNPNNPLGTLLPKEGIIRLAKAAPESAILVDECYFEYTQETVKDFINTYPNLFIIRTFSKTWGLASLRLGYVMSRADNIEHLLKIRGPYDVNRLAVVAAEAALADPGYMEEYIAEVLHVSMPLLLNFFDRKNIRYWPTKANFVLFYPLNPKVLENKLRERGILVRPRSGPKIEGSVRINVGTKMQTERLLAALEEIL